MYTMSIQKILKRRNENEYFKVFVGVELHTVGGCHYIGIA